MRVAVTPLRQRGRNIPKQEYLGQPQAKGEFSLSEERDPELSRTVTRARLVDASGVDLLPELSDARVLSIAGAELRLCGYERVEKVGYAQTWLVEVLPS